jgi:hypothetical protein
MGLAMMREQTNSELLLDIYASAWVIAVATLLGGIVSMLHGGGI